jgi:DUF1009 family protein
MPPLDRSSPVGLLAGWGRYPLVVAEALRAQGRAVFCLGADGHADPALAALCHDFAWIGLGKLGRAIRYFRRHGVRRATMAGKFHKVVLYQPWFLLKNLPDWRAIRSFYPFFMPSRKDRKDDTMLGALVHEFAADGIRFEPATNFVPELLVKPGQLTARGPSRGERLDIDFGWRLAKEMGRLDVGQSVAVKDRGVLAVEAIEGTDECIRRAGALCARGNFTVVKVAKPQQDMRFDVPTIGRGTLEAMLAAGGRVLAVEAGRTIFIDQAEVVAFADAHQLVIVALEPREIAVPHFHPPQEVPSGATAPQTQNIRV